MAERLLWSCVRKLLQAPGPERPAGGREHDALDGSWIGTGNRLEDRRVLESTGTSSVPAWRTAFMKISPARTRHSLLASATRRPWLTAASVGRRPAAPMMPAITQSAGRTAAATSAAAPAATSMPLPESRSLRAP
jgi:hypothetical protein